MIASSECCRNSPENISTICGYRMGFRADAMAISYLSGLKEARLALQKVDRALPSDGMSIAFLKVTGRALSPEV